jgi:hypothetical protein
VLRETARPDNNSHNNDNSSHKLEMEVQTGRQVLRLGTPSALIVAQRQLQDATILEEAVRDPVLRVRLAIERSALDVDVLIAAIKVDVPNRGCLASKTVGDINLREERRYDEVYVLPAHGPRAHHG